MGKPYLRVMTRGRDERRFVIETDVIGIGRSAGNVLAVPDLSLSREHARLVRRDGAHFISDRGSRNGTQLNDRPLAAETVLKDGDVVRLGETTLIFCAETPSSSGVRMTEQPLSDGSVAISASSLLSSTFRGTAPGDARLIDVFARASRMLIAKAEAQEVFDEVLEASLRAVGGERGALLLREGDSFEVVPRATLIREGEANLTLSRTMMRRVLEQRASLITTDAQIDERFDAAQSVNLSGIRSAMCAPLWHDETVAGVLYVDRRISSKPFAENDLAILTVLANLTAAKIENLRLLEESLAKRKLDEELKLASEIQRNLLPADDPRIAGWDFAAMSLSSREVGGDLFDYIRKPSGRIGLVVADVSGKGVSAALLMASLQANLRAFAQSTDDLGQMMSEVNRALHATTARNRFATVFYAELDPLSGRLSYVNAGHNPGLLVRADGSIEQLAVGGLIVGAFAQAPRYRVGSVEMRPGDTLLLYSDGVTEADAGGDELFGDARLEECLRLHRKVGCAAIRDAVLEAVHAFTGGRPPADDTTLLVAKRG